MGIFQTPKIKLIIFVMLNTLSTKYLRNLKLLSSSYLCSEAFEIFGRNLICWRAALKVCCGIKFRVRCSVGNPSLQEDTEDFPC